MKKIFAILLCLVMLFSAAQAEIIYEVAIHLEGIGLIQVIADSKPVWGSDNDLVVIKSAGITYYTSWENVLIMAINTDEYDEDQYTYSLLSS